MIAVEESIPMASNGGRSDEVDIVSVWFEWNVVVRSDLSEIEATDILVVTETEGDSPLEV